MQQAQATARVDAITQYRIIGEPTETHLESLARLAATLCRAPSAAVNIIDDRYQHAVATVGVEAGACSIDDSMCAVVLPEARHVLVTDAQADARFAANPFVRGGRVRFYASSPLITPSGVPIGTLCVFARETGTLSDEQSAALDLLAGQAVEVLELRRATHELERSNDELAHFAGQVSHDLRNPLTAMLGQIDLAIDALEAPAETGPQNALRALGHADAAAARMDRMITDLLAYAKVGGARPRSEPASMRGIVESAVADLEGAVTAFGASVSIALTETDGATGDIVVGDPTLLGVLMQNLIANALKFTATTRAAPTIAVTAQRTPTAWAITVDDDGPGVPVDQRERVFGAMERGWVKDVPGLGLGLATCRRIAQAHGGTIVIEDSPRGGARVRVWLPQPE